MNILNSLNSKDFEKVGKIIKRPGILKALSYLIKKPSPKQLVKDYAKANKSLLTAAGVGAGAFALGRGTGKKTKIYNIKVENKENV